MPNFNKIRYDSASRDNTYFFKGLQAAREGQPVSLSADVIGCGGGKLYTGFSDMPERVPGFVSLKEKYKKTKDHQMTLPKFIICIDGTFIVELS